MKRIFLLVLFLILSPANLIWAEGKALNIVTTQTIFADLVKQVGKEKVNVSAIASPKYNIHFIQPKPSDVRKVSKADLYVNGGLDLEAWSEPLLEAVGKPKLFRHGPCNVDLSQGITLLGIYDHLVTRAEGDIHLFGNPHFQMNPENARFMIQTILSRLSQIDPANKVYYQDNAKEFLDKLDQKIIQWKSLCSHCSGQEIISYHENIVYFTEFLKMKDKQYLESKPGIPPTPKHLIFLEEYARLHQIKAIVLPTFYSRVEAEKLALRIGAKVVIIAQGVGEVPGTGDFFSFFDYNFKQISKAIAS